VSLHLALTKLDPSCLIEALSIYYNLHYCRRTGFPPLLLDLVYRSFLPSRPCIHRVCHLFPHFCLLCICYDIPLFWPNYGYVFLHKKTKSALEKCSPLRLFSFKQTISDIFFYKEYYGIMGYYPPFKLLTHWLLIHSTIQRLSNVKLSSGYGSAG
jgi:hypothetical protein